MDFRCSSWDRPFVSRVRFWRQLCFLAVCVPVTLKPVAARAQAQRAQFALDYSAAAIGCPSREAFVRAVSMRAPAALEVAGSEAALALEVRLEGSGDRATGVLTVRRPDGLSAQREVPEGACAEVAESLAVIVGMLLQQREFEEIPQQARDGAQGASGTQAAGADQVANAQPSAQRVASEAPRVSEQGPPRRVASPSARAASAPANTRAPWGLGLTFASLVESEASPSLAFGLLVGVEGFWERDSLWSPSARLAAYQVDAGREVTPQGDASFRLRALRLSICPLRWLAHAHVALRACAVFDAGELRARGEVASGKTLTMPWFAAGAGGRLALAVFPFLDLEGEAAVQVLSRHDEFVFEPNGFSVHSVAPVTLGAGLGLTLRTF